MENPDIIRRIEKLTKHKQALLKCFCNGMSFKNIADKFVIEEGTVRAHLVQIYEKLELDLISVSERRTVLLRLYCRVFEKYIQDSGKEGEKSLVAISKKDFEEEDLDESELSREEKTHKQEIEKMVEEDSKLWLMKIQQEKARQTAPIEIVTNENVPRRRISTFQIIMFVFALIGFAAVVIVGYEFISGIMIIAPAIEETRVENTPESITLQLTQVPALAQPELTQTMPVTTESPTTTPTAPPKPAILFEDDFDSGLSDAWEVVSGNPIVVNGTLSTDQDTWLLLGDLDWVNYSIEFSTNSPSGWTSQGFNALGVRADTIDNMYAYKWAEYDSKCFILENGDWSAVPQTDFIPGREAKSYRFTIIDDLFTIYMNGEKQTSFFDKRYSNGKIALKLFANTVIDDFKVREILD